MIEQIFKDLEYIYSKPKYNKLYLKDEILSRCNGDGTILKEVLKLVDEYRDNLNLFD